MDLRTLRNDFVIPGKEKYECDIIFAIAFEHVTKRDCRTSMIIGYDLSGTEERELRCILERVQKGEPIQYVTGTWEFMGRPFIVTPDVLIPRADTEILCEHALNYIKGLDRSVSVLDLCTGSGCIGISIACLAKNSSVTCADISQNALCIAKRNAQLNNVNIETILSDMLENCGVYDVITSNPPYIPSKTIDELEKEVKDHEPHMALDGGCDGLDFYRIIARDAKKHIFCGGRLFVEIGYDQRESVKTLFSDAGYVNIECVKDYGGNDRVIICEYRG